MTSTEIPNYFTDWDNSQLAEYLYRFNIDPEEYGKGNARTLDTLLKELRTGESKLFIRNEILIREVFGVGIQVYYKDEDNTFYLKQAYSEYKDGRKNPIVQRKSALSVTEKMFPTEDPVVAVRRGLLEELGIMSEVNLVSLGFHSYKPRPSESYPGLLTKHNIHGYLTYLPENEFVPHGYVEHQEEKDNYFEWIKLSDTLNNLQT